MDDTVIYPISEIFNSLQGEGYWAGTRMTFVRLAGCSVGKPFTPAARATLDLPIYREQCHDWAGNAFICDTDYRVKFRMNAEGILEHSEMVGARRVCITGGEPLIHDLAPLILACNAANIRVHVETSGTKPLMPGVWNVVSPKHGYLRSSIEMADELKILVGHDFNETKFQNNFLWLAGREKPRLYFQPIGDEHKTDDENLRVCIELTRKYPTIRLSAQLHKYWGIR